MKLIIAAIALTLAGCATPIGYNGMSPEQINALAKMKDANVSCVVTKGAWGTVVGTYVQLDKGVVPSGNVSVDSECKVTITSTPIAKP